MKFVPVGMLAIHPKQFRFCAYSLILGGFLGFANPAPGNVVMNCQFGVMTGNAGDPIPEGSLWIMVYDDNEDGLFPGGLATDSSVTDSAAAYSAFAGRTLAVGTIIEGDRIFAVGGTSPIGGIPGTTGNTINLDLQESNLVPGRKWAFYWFPGLTPSSPTVPESAFEVGGINEVTEIQPGSSGPMTIPGDGLTVIIAVYDTALDGGSTLPPSRFRGLLAEPENDFAFWIAGFFPGESDPAIVGFDADPDNDGLPNGVESILGTAPNAPSRGLGPPVSASSGALVFVTTLAKDAPSDVSRAWEWSPDLVHWFSDGGGDGTTSVDFTEAILDDSDPVRNQMEITASITENAPSRVFVRLAVSQ